MQSTILIGKWRTILASENFEFIKEAWSTTHTYNGTKQTTYTLQCKNKCLAKLQRIVYFEKKGDTIKKNFSEHNCVIPNNSYNIEEKVKALIEKGCTSPTEIYDRLDGQTNGILMTKIHNIKKKLKGKQKSGVYMSTIKDIMDHKKDLNEGVLYTIKDSPFQLCVTTKNLLKKLKT